MNDKRELRLDIVNKGSMDEGENRTETLLW